MTSDALAAHAKTKSGLLVWTVLGSLCLVLPANGQEGPADGSVLPYPDFPFQGELGPTIEDSAPQQFVPIRKPPEGAPNIFIVLTDDVGFGSSSTFGGPVATPNLEKLADNGLRYNNFHVNPVCSPTRASLLTGRNSHSVGAGITIEGALGYPAYNSVIPKSTATIAEVLKQNGYSTAMFGKHHNTPRWLGTSAGPFDTWPTGLGFDYFYGFIGGDTDQYRPVLIRGTTTLATPNDANYLLDEDLADQTISWIHNQKGAAPDRPFFVYYATGTLHAPHQAPDDWIARFKGRFDKGWDEVRAETVGRQKATGLIPASTKVSERPHDIPAWSSLSGQQKKIYARMMEVAAGTLAFQDHQIGRVFAELERMGELDNTLVIFIHGDNGASAEGGVDGFTNEMGKLGNAVPEDLDYLESTVDELGGPKHYNNYPAGWAWANNAPFPFFKQVASHLGGTTDGMVVSWPERIAARGELRSQFHHVIDIYPTIMEMTRLTVPRSVNGVSQRPLDGVSMAYTFANDADKFKSRHLMQYFEFRGHKAIYHDGWWANTTPKKLPWSIERRDGLASGPHKWELYNLNVDYAQANDVSVKHPQKLEELKALWLEQAKKNDVLPIVEEVGADRFLEGIKNYGFNRPHSVYWGAVGMPEGAAPSLYSTSFTITADLELRENTQGVILATGGRFGGWSFYLKDGQIVAFDALSQQERHHYRVAAPLPKKTGSMTIVFDFKSDDGAALGRGGTMRISANGMQLASGRIQRTSIVPQNAEEFNVGYDSGALVSPEYHDQFSFTGEIRRVVVERR